MDKMQYKKNFTQSSKASSAQQPVKLEYDYFLDWIYFQLAKIIHKSRQQVVCAPVSIFWKIFYYEMRREDEPNLIAFDELKDIIDPWTCNNKICRS